MTANRLFWWIIGCLALSLPVAAVAGEVFQAGTGQQVRVAARSGQGAIAMRNGDGDMVVLTATNRSDGAWSGWVINRMLGTPPPLAQGDLWFDPKDGLLYVAAPTAAGLMLYRQGTDGAWTVTNLTTQSGDGATAIVSGLTHFITPDLARDFDGNLLLDEHGNPIYPIPEQERNNVHIAGLDAAGNVVVYSQRRDEDHGPNYWVYTNITRDYLLPGNQELPDWRTTPVGYATPWNGWNIAGLDGAGRIIAVWTAPDRNGVWATTNLSASYGTPALAGGLSAYVNWGINLTGVLADGSLGVTWWSAQLEQERKARGRTDYWAFTNLTEQTGGPHLQPDSITNYTTPHWPSNNIIGLDREGNVVVYWWTPDNQAIYGREWMVDTLPPPPSGGEAPVGRLAAAAAGDDTFSLVGVTEDGDVLRYLRSGTGDWTFQNATEASVDRRAKATVEVTYIGGIKLHALQLRLDYSAAAVTVDGRWRVRPDPADASADYDAPCDPASLPAGATALVGPGPEAALATPAGIQGRTAIMRCDFLVDGPTPPRVEDFRVVVEAADLDGKPVTVDGQRDFFIALHTCGDYPEAGHCL